MPLSITSRPDRNFQVITLTGNLTLGPHLRTVQQTARSVLESAAPDGLILDVAGIKYADSAGLGELVSAYTTATNQGGSLKLLHLQGKLHDLMQITKLHTIFPAFDDEKKAVESFGAGAAA